MFYCLSVRLSKISEDIITQTLQQRIEALLAKGYTCIALDICVRANTVQKSPPVWPNVKLPENYSTNQSIKILKRLTLSYESISEVPANRSLPEVDILALEPLTEVAFSQTAMSNKDVDIISLSPDVAPFKMSFGSLKNLESSGICVEIHYSRLLDSDCRTRAFYLASVLQLMRASRRRNFLFSWGADEGTPCLDPYQACAYMQQFFMVSPRRAMEAITTIGTKAMLRSKARKAINSSYFIEEKNEDNEWKFYDPFNSQPSNVAKMRKQ